MRWTRQRRARIAIAGRVNARERSSGARTNGADADGEVVWSWHPLLVSSSRRRSGPTGRSEAFNPRTTVAKRNSSPGRARRTPLKPLRREGRMIPPTPVVTTVCYLFAHGPWVQAGTRPSLRPLVFEGGSLQKFGCDLHRENKDSCPATMSRPHPSRRGASAAMPRVSNHEAPVTQSGFGCLKTESEKTQPSLPTRVFTPSSRPRPPARRRTSQASRTRDVRHITRGLAGLHCSCWGKTRSSPSPRAPVTGVLREIAVRGLFTDVVLLVVAMALGGVERNGRRAARALVALVLVGDRLDGLGERFCHHASPFLIEGKRRARRSRSDGTLTWPCIGERRRPSDGYARP